MVARIFRLFSYLFHLILALYLLGLVIVALTSSNTLKMPFLPWTGQALTQWLLWGGVAGILSVGLAVTGVFRFLFPFWALAVFVVLVRGFLLQPYSFADKTDFQHVLLLIAGALLAFLASLSLFRRTRRRRL